MTTLSDLELVKVDAPLRPFGNWVWVRYHEGFDDKKPGWVHSRYEPTRSEVEIAEKYQLNFHLELEDGPPADRWNCDTYIVDTFEEACALFGESHVLT